jgi:hypothetical protein
VTPSGSADRPALEDCEKSVADDDTIKPQSSIEVTVNIGPEKAGVGGDVQSHALSAEGALLSISPNMIA